MYCDMHIHSCLSPCGEDEMLPNDIVQMALINGLQMIAVCDHNSCANVPAVMAAAAKTELAVVPAMELCTAEEVHILCYFTEIQQALAFSDYVYQKLPEVQNVPRIFGNQFICDENDRIVSSVDKLLTNAAEIPLEELPELMRKYAGTAIPAHIEKGSNSILSNLGFIPPEFPFVTTEIFISCEFEKAKMRHAVLSSLKILKNSDAHCLVDILERQQSLPLSENTAAAFVSYLKEEIG